MQHAHKMRFGAEVQPDGRVHFGLWAPIAKKVDVCIYSAERSEPIRSIPLVKCGDWFELLTDQAHSGDLYRYRIDGGAELPDPVSRFQPQDVHGPSMVVDSRAFAWKDDGWRGLPWASTVFYEVHVGTFSPQGTFAGVEERLDYLSDLGITAIELMPVSDFPGKRNWGYDGVFPFSPDSTYGTPDDLKRLIQSAHERGLMVFLDVVYNHFGPDGNYLRSYAPQFFTSRHCTPWGDGINFDDEHSRPVRDFFVHNALYWLQEYRFDGLRLDAVNAIQDDSKKHILTEIAETVHDTVGAARHVHLVLENERNQASYLVREKVDDGSCRPTLYSAQWNDDIHHAYHVLVTGEDEGYYSDYVEDTISTLGRCLTEGFAYQGDISAYSGGKPRGEVSAQLPSTAFIAFLQNHDQIGNRALGERLNKICDPRAMQAATAILLLAPSIPLMFMGEEFGAQTPFLFFCNFEDELANAVTVGRRAEFSKFSAFQDPARRDQIPDPNAESTFLASKLQWNEVSEPSGLNWLLFTRRLLRLRREKIVPLIEHPCGTKANYRVFGDCGLEAKWEYPDSSCLTLQANLGDCDAEGFDKASGELIFVSDELCRQGVGQTLLPAWSVAWWLKQ